MVIFDQRKISAALLDFYNATGINMDLLKADFSPAGNASCSNPYCTLIQSCSAGRSACRASDISLLETCRSTGEPAMRLCHAGLIDVAIPIHHDYRIIGYLIFGRMRPDRNFPALQSYLSGLGIDPTEAANAYHSIPLYDEEKIHSLSNIATLLVKYILLENLLISSQDDAVEKAAAYIHENLSAELTIQSISRATNISKSVLYKGFRSRYRCTVGEFLNARRVAKAKELLQRTALPMEEIAQQVGFSSGSYFSKAFKKVAGISPLQFRKENK